MLDRNVRGIGIALCLLTLFIFLTGCGSLKDDTLLTVNAVITEVDAGKQTITVKDDADESTLFFHDKPTEEESLLFVGHVGVLLTAEDGTLYFVEKVAFQEPYRMLRFADRTALSDYLMGKYDTSWGQDTASPFIMENDKLMDIKTPHSN